MLLKIVSQNQQDMFVIIPKTCLLLYLKRQHEMVNNVELGNQFGLLLLRPCDFLFKFNLFT